MANPALICCLVFIAFLLRRDSRRRSSLSWAIWIPTFFLLIVGSRSLSLWLGGSQSWGASGLANDAETSPIDQLFFFSTLACSLGVAISRRVKFGKFFAANIPLMLFYLYFAVSVSWSEDPLGSTKRLIKDFGLLFVISVILSEKNPREAIRAVYVRCACILFPLSAVFIKWFPKMARSFTVEGTPMYTGVTTQKNTLGEIVLVFSLFLIWDYLETRPAKWRWKQFPWDHLLLLVMGVWLLQMCQSKTALMCLVLGTGLLLRSGWLASKVVSQVVLIGTLALPYLVFFAERYNSLIAPVVEAVGRNMTFTGRTDIWQHITATTVNPLIGAGYYNFWGGTGGLRVNEAMHQIIPNAHNGYVDMYLDGGVIGLILLFFMLVAYGRRLMNRLRDDRFQRLRFAVLIVVMVYNLSESMYARVSPIWFTTLLVLVDFPYTRIPRKKNPGPLRSERDHMTLATADLPR